MSVTSRRIAKGRTLWNERTKRLERDRKTEKQTERYSDRDRESEVTVKRFNYEAWHILTCSRSKFVQLYNRMCSVNCAFAALSICRSPGFVQFNILLKICSGMKGRRNIRLKYVNRPTLQN